jgi:uncharacterized protein
MTTTATSNGIDSSSCDDTTTTTVTKEFKPPVPPFSYDDAVTKVRKAEDAWNSRNPDKIKMAYTEDTVWRNRSQFLLGRDQVSAFLTEKFASENGYRLIKEIWAHSDNRIAVRFCYEFHNDEQSQWFRAYGNENWEFDDNGLMKFRHASINDVPINESERKFHVSRLFVVCENVVTCGGMPEYFP